MRSRLTLRFWFRRLLRLLGLLACFGAARAQTPADPAALAGQVRDQATGRPLGFVSVSVVRHPYGTVADAQGRFSLRLPPSFDADTVRFSLLGYASRAVAVAELRRLVRQGAVALRPQAVPLGAARVRASGLRRVVVGNSGGGIYQGFSHNLSGNQVGQSISVKRPAFLQDVSFRISHCSYDTVFLRLNVYWLQNGFPAQPLLPRPLYLRVSQAQTDERIYVSLRPYKLWVESDVAVCLELVRSLDKGTLIFLGKWPGGGPSYRLQQTPGPLAADNVLPQGMMEVKMRELKQPDRGPWTQYPGVGLAIEATLLEVPEP